MNGQDTPAKQALVISVQLLDDRYHGAMDWPPSPFQLFQALVAAAGLGRELDGQERAALVWLEALQPPVVLAPRARQSSRGTTYFVIGNSVDQCGGDIRRAAKMRDAKISKPWLIQGEACFKYIWEDIEAAPFKMALESIVNRLYQLGRGIDMAYASMDVRDMVWVKDYIQAHDGVIYRADAGNGSKLRCPEHGTLNSLRARHAAQQIRLKDDTLMQAPRPVFTLVAYNSRPAWLLFDILERDSDARFYPQPACRIVQLTERIRDLMAKRLGVLQGKHDIERIVIGSNAGESDKRRRIRIIPLLSVGSQYADQSIRRVLVEVPPDCPVRADDIQWSLSGLDLSVDIETGELMDEAGPLLALSTERKMLAHYGVVSENRVGWRTWRSVTPVALYAPRFRGKMSGERKAAHLLMMTHAMRQALRHAGCPHDAEILRIQQEPFDLNGEVAGRFAYGKRFLPQDLFHVEIRFSEPLKGPLVAGRGRFLGLGLFAPCRES
ncbi:MAG TPA: type I-U CRISPR-associated protein Cas5/Cas6 [Devosia sp.]|nr:type I-U CRISPR-associated protein Cas5/Cas6 [Devosia sp.]